MGRPREHDERTAAALLDAAEQIVQENGLAALSVRTVASRMGTTTRAVYSLYGSKDGLLVALGRRAFHLLGDAVARLPHTDDPAADLVDAGAVVFRRFATDHPGLFRIGIQHTLPAELAPGFRGAATDALTALLARIGRLEDAGLLGSRTAAEAACAFHALCEGLAAIELRAGMPAGREEQIWRDALSALVAGFAVAARQRRSHSGNAAGPPLGADGYDQSPSYPGAREAPFRTGKEGTLAIGADQSPKAKSRSSP